MTVAAMLSRESRRWGDRDNDDGKEEVGEVDNTQQSTTAMTTTITSPATIESTVATVLVPNLACRGFDVVIFTELSCAVRKYADAHDFEHHRCADIHAFVLSQGRRDDGTNSIVVGNSSGNVHRGGRGTDDGNNNGDGNSDDDGDDILC